MTPLNKLVSILAPIMGKDVDDPEVLKVVVELMMAVRKPSQQMIDAARAQMPAEFDYTIENGLISARFKSVAESVSPERPWQAMIDALLTEGG